MSRQNRNAPPAPSVDWAYFLDVDGTLIDIAETPDAVRVDATLLDLIEQLHLASGGAVALVSGRTLTAHFADTAAPLEGWQVIAIGVR